MRLDIFLSGRGLAKSRSQAKELIENGLVAVDGKVIKKPALDITGATEVKILGRLHSYVGRGGIKLAAALDGFKTDVTSMCAADIGASTGGFTDCLLKRGARRVYAIDSGAGQLDKSLLDDERVVNIEHFNARNLSSDTLDEKCDIAVADLSFISQTLIIPHVPGILADGGIYLSLVKPQFECGRTTIGKGGIVREPHCHLAALMKVKIAAEDVGFGCTGVMMSPIEGGDGNREFLMQFILGEKSAVSDGDLHAAVYTKIK